MEFQILHKKIGFWHTNERKIFYHTVAMRIHISRAEQWDNFPADVNGAMKFTARHICETLNHNFSHGYRLIHSSAAWWFSSVEIVFFTSSLILYMSVALTVSKKWYAIRRICIDTGMVSKWPANHNGGFRFSSCDVHAGQMIELFSMANTRLASFKVIAFISNKVYPLSLVIQTIPIVFEHFSIDRWKENWEIDDE